MSAQAQQADGLSQRGNGAAETTPYDDHFFGLVDEGSERSARVVVPLILGRLSDAPPRSILDIGCGTGTWLTVFEQHAIADSLGIDGDYIEPGSLRIPRSRFMAADLVQPLVLDRRFDLALCLEVGKHLPASAAGTLVDSLCSHSDLVLFSAAIPGQGGTHHINEQWPDYWHARFAKRGYTCIDWIRPLIWEDTAVDWWYAQNLLMYAAPAALERSGGLRRLAERSGGAPRRLIHPRLYDKLRDDAEGLRSLRYTPGLRWCTRAMARGLQRAVASRLPSL
jgi:SAM-dependent methyltransferase